MEASEIEALECSLALCLNAYLPVSLGDGVLNGCEDGIEVLCECLFECHVVNGVREGTLSRVPVADFIA